MRTDLDPAQIAAYRRDGCLVIRNFLSPQEVAALTQEVVQAAQAMGKAKLGGERAERAQEGDGFYDRVFFQRVNLWRVNPAIKELITDPRLGRMLCELEGIDGIRVWHDQTLQKAPWANPTAYHLDNPYWSFSSPHAISIWIALDEATLQNGCLSYIPGSHRVCTQARNSDIGIDFGDFFKRYPELKDTHPVLAPMRPGDAGLHNGLTAHGAGPNNTPGWRRAMTCAYMPEGATYNGQLSVLPESYAAGLQVGDVLDDDAIMPLAYSRRVTADCQPVA
jgi:phytanoyl-CoA hydroxylase